MTQNAHAIKPVLPEPFPDIPPTWTDPVTGLIVPKVPIKNLQWRADLLERAEEDEGLQRDLYTACSQSILFWINAFAFTFRVFEDVSDKDNMSRIQQAEQADVPYVTWAIQDKHILAIEDAIDNAYSMLTDKTREMGASWDHVVAFHHQFLFRKDRLFLELSRVETDVDGADNPRCLFVKHDYLNKWLPRWMLPTIKRSSMHIINKTNGSRIDGESSNKAAGSSDRRHAVLLDEMAKMENARKIKSSLRDVSRCLLPNSTPWGPGTAYTEWRFSGQVKVFVLPWWEHPEKGQGRYAEQDEITGKWKVRSPWYDGEEMIRSPQEMAQEIDMDHIGSGNTYFESMSIEEHKRLFARKSFGSVKIDFRKGVATDAIPKLVRRKKLDSVQVRKKGPWRLWTELVRRRPDQTKNYIFGIDISKGQGASNSVVSVICVETREVVAEYADANTPPYDLARIVCAAAIWFGGARHGGRPFVIWESQGPGWDFGRQMVKVYQYPYFFSDREARTIEERRTRKYGWHSTNEKKEVMLGILRRLYAHGGIIHHSEEALNEALSYIYLGEGGGIGPTFLLEESASARKTHGDRVVATGLAAYALEEVPTGKRRPVDPPARSAAARRKMRMRQRKRNQKNRNMKFDWRYANAS
jgi:hypothetical protein